MEKVGVRLAAALAVLAVLVAVGLYALRWGLPWDDDTIGKLPNVDWEGW